MKAELFGWGVNQLHIIWKKKTWFIENDNLHFILSDGEVNVTPFDMISSDLYKNMGPYI